MAAGELRVITNAQVLTPAGPQPASLAWRNDQIVGVAPDLPAQWVAGSIEDVNGALILPGFIDPHVHSREPGMVEKETFKTMTAGALKGGVTTVFEMPNSKPPLLSCSQFEDRADFFISRTWVNFGLWGLALGDDRFDDIAGLFRAGAVGIKAFYGYRFDVAEQRFLYTVGRSGTDEAREVLPALDVGRLRRIAEQVAGCDGVLAVHCEDPAFLGAASGGPVQADLPAPYRRLLEERPAQAEDAAVATAIDLAEHTGCSIHVVHLASGSAVPLLAEAKSRGLPVTAETAPHYWLLCAEDIADLGSAAKVNPPIREDWHRKRIHAALVDGTIDFVASDHAPHTKEQKQVDILQSPAGMSGIDTIGPLAIDAYLRGHIGADTLLRVTSSGAATLFNLGNRKGVLHAGADADFIVVDTGGDTYIGEDWMWSKAKQTPFAGRTLKGRISRVVVGGEDHLRDGQLVQASGASVIRLQETA